MSYIEFKNVIKEYKMGEVTIKALDNANFSIDKGELVVIVGPSGAGKTTTLNILGGMDRASSGRVLVNDKEITKLNNKQLIEYRRNDIGFVFQFYNLVQNLTAKENVELATQICSDALNVDDILEKVGLQDRKNNFPPFDIWFLLEIILPGQSIISKSEQQKSNRYYSIAMLLLLRDYTFPKKLLVLHNQFCEKFCP